MFLPLMRVVVNDNCGALLVMASLKMQRPFAVATNKHRYLLYGL